MSCCASAMTPTEVCRASVSTERQIERERMIAGSVELADGQFKTDFIVPEMHCAGCIGTIERGLGNLPPVRQVRANLSNRTVSVIWDGSQGEVPEIAEHLNSLGFDNHLADNAEEDSTVEQTGKRLLMSLAVAGFAAANIMLLSVSVWSGADAETAHLFHLISGLIAVPTIAFSGQPFFKSAIKALSNGRLNMDVPISLAVILALGMSLYEGMTGGEEAYFDASVTLLFFLLIGRYLDHLMRERARGAVERLAGLSAKSGTQVLPDGNVELLSVREITSDMVLRVYAGERFPVDGVVVSGHTEIDCSHVTGESEPVELKPEGAVSAGALNLSGMVDFRATSDASNSFLAEMRNMMAEAENGRSGYVRIADRMAQIYAPAVHLLALITFVAWMIVSGGEWQSSLYIAIAVLIITCPCALGLAVPVAHVIGANRLMQAGILMRDGSALERLAEIDHVIFDKTGTLTDGMPMLDNVADCDPAAVSIIKAMAEASTHPAAKAVARYYASEQASRIADVSELPGLGVEASFNGKVIRLGKPDWAAEIAADHKAVERDCSLAFVMSDDAPVAFELTEALRDGAGETVKGLEKLGLDQEILSGDSMEKVQTIATKLGIADFHYRQDPRQKIDHITAMKQSGKKVLMVGDGINDAPALAAGHASMVPASASDVGRHAADFVFTRGSLDAVVNAVVTARKTATTVRQNFGLAILYNCIAVPLAMAGFVTPLIAAIAMSASSIVVVANSLRIGLGGLGVTTPKDKSAKHKAEPMALEVAA